MLLQLYKILKKSHVQDAPKTDVNKVLFWNFVAFQENIISSFFPLMTHLMFVFSNSGRLHRHFHQSKRCRGKNLPHDVPVKIKSTFIIIGLPLYYKRLYRDGNQNKTWFSEAIFELNRTKAFKLVTEQALKIAYCQTILESQNLWKKQ